MYIVLLTALGVGGATLIGSSVGFIFKKLSHKFSDIILSFAAGVMLCAAVFGLIIPSMEYAGSFKLLTTIAGIFTGAFTASAAGICAAMFFGLLFALIFKSRDKNN